MKAAISPFLKRLCHSFKKVAKFDPDYIDIEYFSYRKALPQLLEFKEKLSCLIITFRVTYRFNCSNDENAKRRNRLCKSGDYGTTRV